MAQASFERPLRSAFAPHWPGKIYGPPENCPTASVRTYSLKTWIVLKLGLQLNRCDRGLHQGYRVDHILGTHSMIWIYDVPQRGIDWMNMKMKCLRYRQAVIARPTRSQTGPNIRGAVGRYGVRCFTADHQFFSESPIAPKSKCDLHWPPPLAAPWEVWW